MPTDVPLTARFRLILVPEKEGEEPRPSDWPANAIDVGIVTVPIAVSFAKGGPVMRGAGLPSSRDPELDDYVRGVIADRQDATRAVEVTFEGGFRPDGRGHVFEPPDVRP